MKKVRVYVEHPDAVVRANSQFKHVMALTLDPSHQNRRGIIRCIQSREGVFGTKGYIDRSVLHVVEGQSLEHFTIRNRLSLRGEEAVVKNLGGEYWGFIGLEDPDIWVDEDTQEIHVYFTIPFLSKDKPRHHSLISLGHAVGKDLESLVMTEPVLTASKENTDDSAAKEVSIAPVNSKGIRYNLFESNIHRNGISYSTVRIAIAKDLGKPWEFGKTVHNPAGSTTAWVAGHSSPGPLLPRSFLDIGKNKLVGILNGRGKNKQVNDVVVYDPFTIGLFIYDYELGKIDWISPEPLIKDSEAKNVTFASHFVETITGEGILYAHVDDSFVRAYTLYAEGIRALLPL